MRVMGDLKSFNNRRSVNATSIKAITDFNEIQYHLLETVYVHLYHTRGPVSDDLSFCSSLSMPTHHIIFSPQPQAGNAGGHAGQGMQRQQQQQQRGNGQDPYAMK